MPTRRTLLLAAACLSAATPLAAQTTPPRGSPLRADLMNALRPTVEAEIGGQIEFVVTQLRVMQQWAFASVQPQRPGGTPIDWRRTKFREEFASDTMSNLVLALLAHDGAGWRVVEYAIGPTDVAWEEWIAKHRLPRQLFID
jgi:hypothetical protein